MTHKSIFLSLLLIPFIIVCNSAIDKRVQALKDDVFARGIKLSRMSSEIIEKQDLLEEIMLKCGNIIAIACKSLDKPEERKFRNEIAFFGGRLDTALAAHDIKGFLTDEFFNIAKTSDVLTRIKALLIKHFIEMELLRELVRRYEEYLQETLNINKEIIKLQK
jgi:hypothetical protein